MLLLSCECSSAILGADFATFLERDFVKVSLVFGSLSFLEWNRVRGGAFLGGSIWHWCRGGVKKEVEVDREMVSVSGRECCGEGVA